MTPSVREFRCGKLDRPAVQRMPFQPWSAPREELLQLQSLTRRVAQLDKEVIRERSRLHAARRAGARRHAAGAPSDRARGSRHP